MFEEFACLSLRRMRSKPSGTCWMAWSTKSTGRCAMRHPLFLQLFKWERNVIPQIDQTPQGVIDNQMPDCDIYLGILRTRFGTPTGNYGSGTEQEFRAALERFNNQGKPWISFYFYNGPVELRTRAEREQYDRVCEFRDELERNGVVGRYKGTRGSRDAFVEQVRSNLIKLVQQFTNEAEKADQ